MATIKKSNTNQIRIEILIPENNTKKTYEWQQLKNQILTK